MGRIGRAGAPRLRRRATADALVNDRPFSLVRDLLHQSRLGLVDALASQKAAPRRSRPAARVRLLNAGDAQFVFASDGAQDSDELIAVIDLRADLSRLV